MKEKKRKKSIQIIEYKEYDYEKAKRRVEKEQPKRAFLFIAERPEWTKNQIWDFRGWLIPIEREPKIAGIRKCEWGTPTLQINNDKEDCYKITRERVEI